MTRKSGEMNLNRLLATFFEKKTSLEFSKELIRDHGPEDGGEVAEEGEGVVDDGGRVLREMKLVFDVDREDGWK